VIWSTSACFFFDVGFTNIFLFFCMNSNNNNNKPVREKKRGHKNVLRKKSKSI
jgi:hypothetical protein